jgi:hypothetical protein
VDFLAWLDNRNAAGVRYKYSWIADEIGDQNFSMVRKQFGIMAKEIVRQHQFCLAARTLVTRLFAK